METTVEAIKGVRVKKRELEKALQREVSNRVTAFTRTTGVAVNRIDIELIESPGVHGERTIVGDVYVDVSL